MSTSVASPAPFTATVLGAARIGPNRELKRALEGFWAGKVDAATLEQTGRELREQSWKQMAEAGLDSIPVNTFSNYDQMLDAAILLGALPERVAGITDPLTQYFAAARGSDTVAPLEMTKWFDTNYHYLVPELSPSTKFELHAHKLFAELDEARALGLPARPVVIGPVTFLLLAKAVDGGAEPISRIDELLPLYEQLLDDLKATGVQWVQFDEPALVADRTEAEQAAAVAAYQRLSGAANRPAILLASYFGRLGELLAPLAATGVEGFAIDLVAGSDDIAAVPALKDKLVLAGLVDGRNIWRADLDAALTRAKGLADSVGSLAISSSCSLLHVPYSLEPETKLDDALRSWLAFGNEKVAEIAALAAAFNGKGESPLFELSRSAKASRAADPRLKNDAVRGHLAEVLAQGDTRSPADQRRAEQKEALGLPPLPTTTIGSYPQTSQIRGARAAFTKGEISEDEYNQRMRDEVKSVIELQENIGLDVLVHGEPERNDMVQYFAEQLDGFFATANGWVQSYGSRAVRPPILFGDVVRQHPMTVEWFQYAQSLTQKPVKGMLTGPVTIIAWSFVRDDQPLADSANQIALAIRDETVDLEEAGARIIQVDEPALRELLPLRKEDQQAYLDWAVGAFRLSTAGVEDRTQVHTHLCYSEFGEVIDAIANLDADVTSIEAARSHMEVLDDLEAAGFKLGVGPGVYDIHSPRVPSVEEIETSLQQALSSVDSSRLWINPDCGLKTRGGDEVEAALRNLVEAAEHVRKSVR